MLRKPRRWPVPSRAMAVALLAVFLNVTGIAYAATGGNFILGQKNTATTASNLPSSNNGKALQLVQQSTGASATALGLNVPAGKPPLTTNSQVKVGNLSAGLLDG